MATFDRLLEKLDRKSFLHIHIWEFGFKSIIREYARLFFVRAVLTYPTKAVSGMVRYRKFLKSRQKIFDHYQKGLAIPDEKKVIDGIREERKRPLLGLGFCLKPYDPEERAQSCPSGRANHECMYLETGRTESICSGCAIYKIARMAMPAGCHIYIMTSANDIAKDFLLPQIREKRFSAAVLLLCPYSIQAILLPLFICGLGTYLLAYDRGNCRNYQEWRRADLGDKRERTSLGKAAWEKLSSLLETTRRNERALLPLRRKGNIYTVDASNPLFFSSSISEQLFGCREEIHPSIFKKK